MGTKLRRAALALVAGMIASACGEAEKAATPKAPTPTAALLRADALTGELRAIPRDAETARPRVAIGSLPAPVAAGPVTPVSARQAASAALSPDAASVVTLRAPGDEEGATWKLVLWDLETGAERWAVALAPDEEPRVVAFRSDGARIAVTIQGQGVMLIDAADGKVAGRVGSPESVARTAVFTADGSRIAVSTEGALELWDAENLTRLQSASSETPFNESVPTCGTEQPPEGSSDDEELCAEVSNEPTAFLSPAGSFFVQVSQGDVTDPPFQWLGRWIQLYASADLARRCGYSFAEFADLGPDAFTPDDRFVAFVPNVFDGADPYVIVLDTQTCEPPAGAPRGQGPVVLQARFVVVSPATPVALVVGDAYTAELWITTSIEPPQVDLLHVLDTERTGLQGAAFSQDGRRVALFGNDGRLQVFETMSGQRLALVKPGDDRPDIRRATFLPDGKRVLVSLYDAGSQAALVDVEQGLVVRRFE
jgi:WD40 repeat protein